MNKTSLAKVWWHKYVNEKNLRKANPEGLFKEIL